MRRVAVTQLQTFDARRNEYRDELDSRWAPLLERFDLMAIQLPNSLENPVRLIEEIQPDAIILSGGGNPGNPESRSQVEAQAMRYALSREIPLLGICRGMQVINLYFGGSLSRIHGHVGVQHEVFLIEDEHSRHTVNSFHEFAIPSDGIGTDLVPLFLACDGTVEAFQHRHLPWTGIMWHPEREEIISEVSTRFVGKLAEG